MLKTVLFDLDGTLLRINEEDFVKKYLHLLYEKVSHLGYEKNELISTIYAGLKMMYVNDGKRSNEEVFWNVFLNHYGNERIKDKETFNDFYENEFKQLKDVCVNNPYAKEIIDFCKKNVENVILSTNPFFPRAGQLTRISFLDLKESDFTYITDYSNSSFCKPNPLYFQSILNKYNLKSDECILFGNNDFEDGFCASSIGIKTYLVKGYIIYDKRSTQSYNEIEMSDVIKTIEYEIRARK